MTVAALALSGAQALAGPCAMDRVDLRGPWGQASFAIEIADDPQERAVGLMGRDSLAATSGMLFLFERPQRAVFWMKETLISLDILFLSVQGEVVALHREAHPNDLTPIDGGPDIAAVLEIRGGLARQLGVSEGTVLRHPAFGAEALWPCPVQ
nr:DUF192 domain-containing protein [Rhodovulum imhoffii]